MINRQVRWLGVVAPMAFVIALEAIAHWLLEANMSHGFSHLVEAAAMVAGILVFSVFMLRLVGGLGQRLAQRNRQLQALYEAGISLTAELELETVLQKVVDLSRELVGARYAALRVVGDAAEVERFVFSGMSPEEAARIGDRPRMRGVLGVVVRDQQPLRLPDIRQHSESVGFPLNHPPMKSFLGVPIIFKGKVLGTLYLSEKETAPEFSQDDQDIVSLFATKAAVTIVNARLYEQVQRLAVLEERERIGMELHDGVIQSIYAVGLHLEDCAETVTQAPLEVQERLFRAVDELNQVIQDIRSYIFDLRLRALDEASLREGLERLIQELRVGTLMDVCLDVQGPLEVELSPHQTWHLLQIAREALNNAAKHARATTVAARLSANNGRLFLSISDNGVGFEVEKALKRQRQGLKNMMERARAVGAQLRVESAQEQGTTVKVELPLDQPPLFR